MTTPRSTALFALAAVGLMTHAGRAAKPGWQEALASAHMDSQQRQVLRAVYESHGGLLWFQAEQPTAQARALATVLAHAEEKGLDARDYGMPALEAQLAANAPQAHARLDVALSSAALELLRDLGRGRIDPRAVQWQLGVERPSLDLAQELTGLIDAPDVAAAVARAETPFAVYRRTAEGLRHYLELATRGEGPALPAWRKTVAPGEAADGLNAVAARLELLGDLAPGAPPFDHYDGALVLAVQHYQSRHGFKADGRIDRATLRALAVTLPARVRQLRLALERMRWLPRDLAPPLLVVNIPEFKVHALSPGGGPELSMKVVVGRAFRHRTPVFMTEVQAVQFHPFWNVPKDIALRELLPKYVAHHAIAAGFELVDSKGHARSGPLDAAAEQDIRSGAFRLRQLPGPANALGPLKLEMPDQFQVYLHGTQALDRFEPARRDFSHGCIRVEDPGALATWVLSGTLGWDAERVRAAVANEVAVRAPLEKPLQVLILYSTSVVTEDGLVSFFDDVYGNDALLEKALQRRSARRGK